MRKNKQQVIEVNGIFHDIDDGYNQVLHLFAQTNCLQDHPDMPAREEAHRLIGKLMGTGMLSTKLTAMYQHHEALKRLHVFTVAELEKTYD